MLIESSTGTRAPKQATPGTDDVKPMIIAPFTEIVSWIAASLRISATPYNDDEKPVLTGPRVDDSGPRLPKLGEDDEEPKRMLLLQNSVGPKSR